MIARVFQLLRAVLLIALAIAHRLRRAGFFAEEKAAIASLSLASLPPLPADTTNRFADSPAAAALGATLFFDHRLSRNGEVACATCHKIDRQFQDDLPRAVATGTNNRRTMPLAGVAWSPWLFWDGRRDSLWAQALTPLEDAVEHAGNRTAYARFMAENFHERYERIFGPLPTARRAAGQCQPARHGGREGRLGRHERGPARCASIRSSPISARRSPPSSAR